MKLKIYKNKAGSKPLTEDLRRTASADSIRMQFGDEVIEINNDNQASARGEQPAQGITMDEQIHSGYDASWVHLVLQKGRLFNIEHPDVPVLYDRGRFQLVAMDPAEAKTLFDTDVCFSVRPVENMSLVFDQSDNTQRVSQVSSARSNLVESVDATNFLAVLERLVGFHNRHSLSDNFTAVTLMLRDELNNLGYATHIEPIDILNRTGEFVGKSSNLIASNSCQSNPAAQCILVTAHLDSVNLQNQLDASLLAPGADDNGSGSAGVMEMARVFSENSGQHDIKFALFGGEEQNLFGSNQYVANMSTEEKEKILAVINMDMIGVRNSTPSTVLIEGAPISREIMNGLALSAATHTDLTVRTSENPFASDHVPFINQGMPAVLTIEGDDSQNGAIHSPADVLALIDADYAQQILKMNVGYIAGLMEDAV